jgi:uncharacterized membrane protein YidH (DUF202 family)
VQRTEFALERTQLAWVRTVFALITAGLALDRGTAALHHARVLAGENWVTSGHFGGIALAGAGTVFLFLATVSYVRQANSLSVLRTGKARRVPPSLPLSALVILLGGTLTYLLWWWG